MSAKIFHPLLALIASASNNELAKYVEFLKEENKILRARIPGQVHTKPDERSRLIKLGKALGQAIEELITLVAPSTFYRWCREADSGKKKPNPKGGQRKSREIREFVIEIAKTTGFGYTRIIGELRKDRTNRLAGPIITSRILVRSRQTRVGSSPDGGGTTSF